MVVEVVVDINTEQVNRPFDYLVPSSLESSIEVGQRVIVPFHGRMLLGIIVLIKETSDFPKLAAVKEILDFFPSINEELIELASKMYKYYFSFYISCLLTMIPAALRAKYEYRIHVVDVNRVDQHLLNQAVDGVIPYNQKMQPFFTTIQSGIRAGVLSLETVIKDQEKIKTRKYISCFKNLKREEYTPKQQEVIDCLQQYESISKLDFSKKHCISTARIQLLIEKGAILEQEQEELRSFDAGKTYQDKVVWLTEEQQQIYQGIQKKYHMFHTFLLHGITGSGKTEIYLSVIQDYLDQGKEAILLVPEISLTPQIVARFKARFGNHVAVLHSGLSIGEKYDEWRKIVRQEVQIVVGARSAIFAPFKNIGVIIIDEEHEKTYQQETNPRYDARVIARIRAKYHQANVILGSATPSIESYFKAKQGIYTLLELKNRANGKPEPQITLIPMTEELKKGNRSMFSRALLDAMKNTLNRKEQVILLMNRRGYSNFILCRECGHTVKCPHCDVTLTYHKHSEQLKCHTCGYLQPNVVTCPECRSTKIRFVGDGTQKVVEELEKLFPKEIISRMDVDTTRGKGAHEKILSRFASGEANILVGTQMIAKGLDFPRVSLVGMLNADASLNISSFDASFQTYSLITQVAGRAGRHETDGTVFIQGYNIDHYAIQYAKKQQYDAFYEKEISYRKISEYPPFVKMIEVMITAPTYEMGLYHGDQIKKILLEKNDAITLLGPVEAQLLRMKDQYRFVLTIKYHDGQALLKELEEIVILYQKQKVNVTIYHI